MKVQRGPIQIKFTLKLNTCHILQLHPAHLWVPGEMYNSSTEATQPPCSDWGRVAALQEPPCEPSCKVAGESRQQRCGLIGYKLYKTSIHHNWIILCWWNNWMRMSSTMLPNQFVEHVRDLRLPIWKICWPSFPLLTRSLLIFSPGWIWNDWNPYLEVSRQVLGCIPCCTLPC